MRICRVVVTGVVQWFSYAPGIHVARRMDSSALTQDGSDLLTMPSVSDRRDAIGAIGKIYVEAGSQFCKAYSRPRKFEADNKTPVRVQERSTIEITGLVLRTLASRHTILASTKEVVLPCYQAPAEGERQEEHADGSRGS